MCDGPPVRLDGLFARHVACYDANASFLRRSTPTPPPVSSERKPLGGEEQPNANVGIDSPRGGNGTSDGMTERSSTVKREAITQNGIRIPVK